MSQIKLLQPKEGVTLLAVKVPEGADEICIPNVYITPHLQIWMPPRRVLPDGEDIIELPEGNWQLLGIATEIPEEVWQGIMPKGKVRYKDFVGGYLFKKATDAAISMLEAHEVYSVNPIPVPEAQFDERGNGGYCEKWIKEYEKAEANTGHWVILKRV